MCVYELHCRGCRACFKARDSVWESFVTSHLCQVHLLSLLLSVACADIGHQRLRVEPPQRTHCQDSAGDSLCVSACVWARVCVDVCACMCACVHAFMPVCVFTNLHSVNMYTVMLSCCKWMPCIKAKFIDVCMYACTSCLRERCTVSMRVHRGVGRCDWKCVAHWLLYRSSLGWGEMSSFARWRCRLKCTSRSFLSL